MIHICTIFRRHAAGKKLVFRCDDCGRDHTSEEMQEIERSYTIRAPLYDCLDPDRNP